LRFESIGPAIFQKTRWKVNLIFAGDGIRDTGYGIRDKEKRKRGIRGKGNKFLLITLSTYFLIHFFV